MILTIIVAVWLIAAIAKGWHQGLVMSLLNLVKGIVVWFAAFHWYQALAEKFTTAGSTPAIGTYLLAFFAIIVSGYVVFGAIAHVSKMVTWLPVVKQANNVGGALLSGALSYAVIFFGLSLMMTMNNQWFTTQYANSSTAQFVVNHMPLTNSTAVANWYNDLLKNDNSDADATTTTDTLNVDSTTNE